MLGFSANHRIDPQQPLSEMGLDSLMAVELRNALVGAVGQNLPATLLFRYPALDDLVNFLAARLLESSNGTAHSGRRLDALEAIEDLSDEEVDRILAIGPEA